MKIVDSVVLTRWLKISKSKISKKSIFTKNIKATYTIFELDQLYPPKNAYPKFQKDTIKIVDARAVTSNVSCGGGDGGGDGGVTGPKP